MSSKILNILNFVGIIFLVVLICILLFQKSPVQKEVDISGIQRKLDSIQQVEKDLYHKIDSLNLTRTKLVTHYETTTLHYDTLRVVIDSMPDTEALYFLLSKSRQLTRKGVE